ncbi:type II secretion system protein F [Halomonas elongata]|uniref:Type II secretion system protein F n=1 Tax=Halomonas elongata TaxID=2746 RepID=A0A1B8NUZ7_HALEL|nr:hypothetical protein [Halomonas elongata]OBX33831.1 type II secretion system protein F [Halomonas elongata]
MPTYRYLALDLEGRRRRDVIQAENERHARELLSDRGLFARRLEEIRGARQRRRGQRLDAERLTLLTRQLATLIDAGIPIGRPWRRWPARPTGKPPAPCCCRWSIGSARVTAGR